MKGKLKEFFELNPTQNTNKHKDFINYIDTASVENGVLTNIEFLSCNFPSRAQRIVKYDDILYSTVRPNLRHYYHYRKNYDHLVASTGFVLIRNKNAENYSTRFLFYYLSSNSVVKHLSNIAELSQSTFPSFSPKDLGKIDLPELTIEKQTKIASILSAYDDLIENNNKRIKILEQMAENLYKEWFVRFRFPGYETAEFVNGIPKGWKIKKLGLLCKIITGKKDVNEAKGDGKYPFFTCSRETNIFTDEYILDGNAILISGNGSYTGFVKKYSGKFDLYQRTYALFGLKKHLWLYLYWAMKINFEREFMGGSRGSAIPYITKPNIEKFEIVVPNENLLCECKNIFESINDICSNLTKQNQNFIKQRDMLLPRLMSGKLEV